MRQPTIDKEMGSTLFIHAVNVHQGGGATLLNALLETIDPQRLTVLNVDNRMTLSTPLPQGLEVRRIKRSVLARLRAELMLYRQATSKDYVLCFGNLPPLLPLRAFTSVFVQNRYLVDDSARLMGLKAWPRLRITVERWWLRLAMGNASQYLVQTPSMLRLMRALTGDATNTILAPFVKVALVPSVSRLNEPESSLPTFLYVASGEPHKNHRVLIDAWRLLAAEGVRPQLLLTIDVGSFSDLSGWIANQSSLHGLSVVNLGTLDTAAMAATYARASALIYPSLFESFGLPLIEASAAGLEIVAAELDYVRDVTTPAQTFDPASAVSIARAVKRFCGLPSDVLPIQDPSDFLAAVIKGSS